MHYSGIYVRCRPSHLERCAAQINACPGVEVYLTDPSSSSLVAVLETETLSQQEAALREVQDLPSVATADLVFHHFEEAPDGAEEASECQH
jgi:nitrate reductase NapAB chaperone NapD